MAHSQRGAYDRVRRRRSPACLVQPMAKANHEEPMTKSREAPRPLPPVQARGADHIAAGMRLAGERRFAEAAEQLGKAAALFPNDP